ncbi:MAG: glycine cleavage system aminomethyltransferase GcvT [Pseudomonadota bacterium]
MVVEDNSVKRTPLHALHLELGGKMVNFAGWELPIQYPAGLMTEHRHCREKCALFDVSHMGQVKLRGDGIAEKFEKLVPASLVSLGEGKARYTFFTNAQGGVLDDLIVSNASDHFFIVVNASMRNQDLQIMRDGLPEVQIEELNHHALIALQGPASEKVLASQTNHPCDLKFMETMVTEIGGHPCRVSRLGYTGEDGFEISMPVESAEALTRAFLSHDDCEPAGLGARDSLRLEAGLCLYGEDIDPTTSPVEAGLSWAIPKRRRENGGFPGAERILNEIENGAARKLVGVRPQGRAPARSGVEIQTQTGLVCGAVTSGGFGPTVEGPVAMGYVTSEMSEPDTKVNLMIRGKPHPAVITPLPFVKQNYKR